jgi:hypothetical protein
LRKHSLQMMSNHTSRRLEKRYVHCIYMQTSIAGVPLSHILQLDSYLSKVMCLINAAENKGLMAGR